ncbi:MAG: DUF5682 family protein [Planctomycetota bacterium]|nr:DUF5682 family protein [Planctomycetota bacterium]
MAKKKKKKSPAAIPSEWQVNVFGVRHLSPSGAWHLRRYLDRLKPDVVLIEGLSDANDLISDITRNGSVPPIAILAYSDSLPVRTLVYPFAAYSPEYQALVWAKENRAVAEFIDLPSDIFLAFQDRLPAALGVDADDNANEGEGDNESDGGEPSDDDADRDVPAAQFDEAERRVSLYDRFAHASGEIDYETYWERRFEHNLSDESYRLAAFEFGRGLRELETDTRLSQAENLVREAYMRRRIQETIEAGYAPEKIVAVVGAYHASVLSSEQPPLSDEELNGLKRRPSKLTLMPYSYFKLSSQSGYGAGNHAPAYFELLWEALDHEDLHQLPAKYLSSIARHMRDSGTHRSTAEVIEGVRLARTLSGLKDGQAPTLADLHDAATTLIGHGQHSVVAESVARVDVGTAIGRLPKGVSKTSIQDDFERELDRLKLAKYRTGVKQELALDLRENRRVKTEDAAFLDLNRSSFLHRLRMLGVDFAEPVRTNQESATWAERWAVQWTPESEIQLVEAVLLGETVELATGYKFRTSLEETTSVGAAAEFVGHACRCGLMKAMEHARRRLQELAAESTEFAAVAHAANELGMVVRYGDVRRFDASPLIPLIADLFVQGALAVFPTAICDNDAAKQIVVGIDELNKVSLEYSEEVDEELWTSKLQSLSDSDDRNPLLSGYACSILLERTLISNEQLAREVSRRLSPGISADLGAGWFEGLAARNRYALLARQALWEQLADYVQSLDDEQFRRALVFLRRAFGSFRPPEKRHIAENLGECWGVSEDVASELIGQEMTEEEEQALSDLNDFDFGDI